MLKVGVIGVGREGSSDSGAAVSHDKAQVLPVGIPRHAEHSYFLSRMYGKVVHKFRSDVCHYTRTGGYLAREIEQDVDKPLGRGFPGVGLIPHVSEEIDRLLGGKEGPGGVDEPCRREPLVEPHRLQESAQPVIATRQCDLNQPPVHRAAPEKDPEVNQSEWVNVRNVAQVNHGGGADRVDS